MWFSFRISLSLAAPLLVACHPSLPHPPYAPQTTDALVVVDSPPPPGRVEHIPPRPQGADAWVDGEWILRRGRWYWLLGRWVRTPAGARYSPWVIVRAPDGTAYYARSVWKDATGHAIDAPTALAVAAASGSAVYDASGNVDNTGRSIRTPPGSSTHSAHPPAVQTDEPTPSTPGTAAPGTARDGAADAGKRSDQ